MDRMTGRSRGFGFVEMATPEAAQKATEAMNGALLDGRPLTVNEARDRAPGGPRGGGPRSFDRGDRGPPRGGFGGDRGGGFGGDRGGGFGGDRGGGFGGDRGAGFGGDRPADRTERRRERDRSDRDDGGGRGRGRGDRDRW